MPLAPVRWMLVIGCLGTMFSGGDGFPLLPPRCVSAAEPSRLEALLQPEAADPARATYTAQRDKLQGRGEYHLAMARWCARQQMPERARAHYFGVLAQQANHPEARQYLGHTLLGDQWIAVDHLAAQQQQLREYLQQLNEWTPELQDMVTKLKSDNPRLTREGLQELQALDASQALPALEFFASNLDDDLAHPLLRRIAELRSPEACQAVVRVALSNPHSRIQQLATQTLREYPQAFYVPYLLSMLSGELEFQQQLVMRPDGHIGVQVLLHRELQDRKQVEQFQKTVSVLATFSASHQLGLNASQVADTSYWSNFWKIPTSAPVHVGKIHKQGSVGKVGGVQVSSRYVPGEVAYAAAANLHEQAAQTGRHVAQQNRQLDQHVHRVCELLRTTTGEAIEDDPQAWWSWWNETNERFEEFKPTSYSYSRQHERLEINTYAHSSQAGETGRDLGKQLIQYSCLTAGNLVQTESGLVPIEEIQIGDLVAAQNVETGDVALKPVLMTTVRPPANTLQIVCGSQSIEATAGHLWWVNGRGWLRSRELEPGMLLQTATGTLAIDQVTADSQPQTTYNLVVDEFHTYFVGKAQVLSYDNTLIQPTLQLVAGTPQ